MPTGKAPKLLVCLASILMLLPGCAGASRDDLVGAWAGEDAEGNEMTLVFQRSGTALWIVDPSGATYDTVTMGWSADFSQDPAHLDLTDISGGPLVGLALYGIVDFMGDDVMRLDYELGPPDAAAEELRPDEFTAETVTFNRLP